MRAKYSGDSRRRGGQREQICRDDASGDRTDVHGVTRVGIENAQSSAVVVAERSIELLRRWSRTSECSRSRSEWIHHGVPYRGVAETKRVTEFVDEQRFEVVRRRIEWQRRWRGERGRGTRWFKVDVGVQNLPNLRGRSS